MDAKHLLRAVGDILSSHVKPGEQLVVGLSGGLDSVVLLHLLRHHAAALNFALAAHHVNHGLSPNALEWQDFCAGLCHSWSVPFAATAARVTRAGGRGLEASAREERYRILSGLMVAFVALAHHQDDQAETLLLRLLRGAGVRGLGGMAEVSRRQAGPAFLRPLLQVPRAALVAYADDQGLQWISDESNADVSFSRNFLRHRVLPAVETRFSAYRENLARAALHCAEASELLDDLAALDAGQGISGDRLNVQALLGLTPSRARNLLRYFIDRHGLPMPDQRRLEEMLRQMRSSADDARLCVAHAGRQLRCFRGQIYVVTPTLPTLGTPGATAPTSFQWQGESEIALPQLNGSLHFKATRGDGIAARLLAGRELVVRLRRGGERLRPRLSGPTRTLKNLLQESAVPPWRRDRLPLLYCDGTLAWVAQIGCAAAFICPPEEEGVILEWIADSRGMREDW